MAQSKPKKKKKKKGKKKQDHNTQAVIVILVLLAILGAALFLLTRLVRQVREPAPVPSPSPSVSVAPTLPPSELSAACFGSENGYKTYISDTVTASLGLDVSSHQGYIDWNAVAESGVDYVILRAGYRGYGDGSIHQDEYFEANIAGATQAGLSVGVYFFSQALSQEEAEAEAHTVLSLVEGYCLDYPIYFDWEPVSDDSARTATISSSELTACAKRFCQTVEEAGYRAGIYFNLSMAMHHYQLYELKDYEFWLAEYQDTPSYPYSFGMWQYTNQGTVPGIDTSVDLNLCFKAYGA